MSSNEPPRARSPSSSEQPAAPAEKAPEPDKGAKSQSTSSSEQTTPPTEDAPVQHKGATNQSPSSSEEPATPAEKAPEPDNGAKNQSPSSSEQTAQSAEKAPESHKGARNQSPSSSKKHTQTKEKAAEPHEGAKNQSTSSSEQTAPAGQAPVQDKGSSNQSPSSSKKHTQTKEKAAEPHEGAKNQSPSSSEQTAPVAGKTAELDTGASNQSTSRSKKDAPAITDQSMLQKPHNTSNLKMKESGRIHGAKEDGVFSIILLGQTGTGKSASANTILAAGKHQREKGQVFEAKPSSMPVTTKCKDKIVAIYGIKVRVVDTPDFFYEDKPVDKAQVEECKKYCQEGQCVVLLVIQLGRFTDGEKGILEKLEDKLGWKIRENAIVLFTHGDDLKGTVDSFIGERADLKHIVDACSQRYHVFNNNSKDTKQVTALFEKFRKESFLKSSSHSQCSLF